MERARTLEAFLNRSFPRHEKVSLPTVPTDAAHAFGVLFIASGVAALLFNAVILTVLFCRRRSIFSHVFYILIFNFTLIDLLKSVCSIVWALKLLPVGASASMPYMKVDQLVLMILRFSNLATILNLLMITLNEFLFIVHPLRYRQIVTSWRVLALIVVCWILAWTFTISILLLGSREQSIYVKPHCLHKKGDSTSNTTARSLPPSCFVRSGTSMDYQFVFNAGVIVFCFACLIISIVCYTALIRVIARIVKADAEMMEATGYQVCAVENNGEHKRAPKQLLKRNKYVIVIGSVIMIYTVYLISYSAIQVLYVTRLTSIIRVNLSRTSTYYVRWIFQSLMCLHSLLQPLCYFRMREFRCMFRNTVCGSCRRNSLLTENTFISMSEQHGRRRSTALPLLENRLSINHVSHSEH